MGVGEEEEEEEGYCEGKGAWAAVWGLGWRLVEERVWEPRELAISWAKVG